MYYYKTFTLSLQDDINDGFKKLVIRITLFLEK